MRLTSSLHRWFSAVSRLHSSTARLSIRAFGVVLFALVVGAGFLGIENVQAQTVSEVKDSNGNTILYVDEGGGLGGFVGVNRMTPIGREVFGIRADAGSYGGMYVETTDAGGWPFYGYATDGTARMWTYYDGNSGSWHVYNGGSERLTVESDGSVGVGVSSGTASRFEVSTEDGEAARVSITDGSNADQTLVLSHRGTGSFISATKVTSNASNLRFEVDNDGNVSADGTVSGGGADVAEAFNVEGTPTKYEPGDVLVISTKADRTVTKSTTARSTRVVGVYATKPGVLLSEKGTDTDFGSKVPMGVVGVIPTKVTAENGAIERGDLLVTAEEPGHAMKAQPKVVKGMEVYPHGAILGKALESFEGPGEGVIKVLVNVK